MKNAILVMLFLSVVSCVRFYKVPIEIWGDNN